jgi:signal transduction histidine kinase
MNGKGRVKVTTAFGENYSVVVTIADSGPGIPAEKLPKILKRILRPRKKAAASVSLL